MAKKQASLIFIFITILVEVIGFGIIAPIGPDLIKELAGEEIVASSTFGEEGWIGALLMISYASMQFLFAPILGEISDKVGRRPVLLISLAGLAIDYVLHATATTLSLLFIGRFLAGICGASFSVASSYIADISAPEDKAKNFGMIGVAFGLGFIIGPVIGGIVGEYFGTRAPFYVAAGLTFLNMLYGLIVLPESLKKENRRNVIPTKMIPGISLAHLSKYKGLGYLIFAFFLAQIAGQSLPSTWSYFGKESFGWTKEQIGYSLGAVGILVAIVQGGLIGPAVKKFGQKNVIRFGFIMWTIGMFLFSIAVESWMIIVFLIPYALGGVGSPTAQGLISNSVKPNEQGNLQGALTSLVGLSAIIGPLLSGRLFYLFTDLHEEFFYFPGMPYAASGILLMFATVFAFKAVGKNGIVY
ncbi:MAG: TCR/Tet family MFS transporter [Bacteroidetes bacterium]|nr:TCR/Tet family MFS transporter [Bacteroidota bacterium]